MLMVFHWSLRDSKSPQVSRTLLSILTVLNNAVVWMVSTRPPTSKSSSPFSNPLVPSQKHQLQLLLLLLLLYTYVIIIDYYYSIIASIKAFIRWWLWYHTWFRDWSISTS